MNLAIKIKLFINKQILDIKNFGTAELFRKFYLFINFLKIILMDFLAILPCIIIRILSPFVIIRIEKIPSANFGDFNLYPAIYYCNKKLGIDQPKKKCIDLVYIHYNDKVFNKQLAIMWKRKLKFFSGYFLDPISRVNKLLPGWEKHTIKTLYSKKREIGNLFEKCKTIEFNKDEDERGKQILNKFGLTKNDKFVCFAIRDGAYQLKKISKRYRDWSYQDFRNFEIDKFMMAAEELASRGYYVFRMGVVTEKKFKSNNSKIIDYANSNLRSDFMDIYLGAKCTFCVATNYGFDALPNIFNKPIVMLGLPLGDLRTNNEKFIIMTKHHILKNEQRKLSLSEIFSLGLAFSFNSKDFEKKGVELVHNSPEEIKDLVLEMTDFIEFNKTLSKEEEDLQKNFRYLYALNFKRFEHQVKKTTNNVSSKIMSRFSTKFLKDNRSWLN